MLSALKSAAKPPKFTLTTLRAYPSLKPLEFIPTPASLLLQPLRRDILWSVVVYERDALRVGSNIPPSRSTNGYSRRKLRPQKGSGKARVGDRNSPTRHDGGRALVTGLPINWETDLNNKVWKTGLCTAMSLLYKEGKLFVIENESNVEYLKEKDYYISLNSKENSIIPEEVKVFDLLRSKRVIIEKNALERLYEINCK